MYPARASRGAAWACQGESTAQASCTVLSPWQTQAAPLLALAGYITARDR